VTRRVTAVVHPVATQPTRVTLVPVTKPKAQHKKQPPVHARAIHIVDVVPLRVDVHRGLGAIVEKVRQDKLLALAGAALLAAVTAAASGAALTLFARRPT
jgi:hypothetical protein